VFPEGFAVLEIPGACQRALETGVRPSLPFAEMRMRFGDCVFDPEARELRRGERLVELSPKAFQLLALLIAHRPRALPHAQLRDALWPDTRVGYTSLARIVSEVRKALGDGASNACFVRTVPRYGYAFTGPAVSEAGSLEAAPCALVADDREFLLPEGETLLGRGPGCAVRLLASGVSRVHACIRVQGGAARIEDRGSKNGTWVNDTRIAAPVALEEGDEVVVGTYRLVFRSAASLDSTRTLAPR
jgi:DNA-binding winged helix-turn-helix (wHTH) protein